VEYARVGSILRLSPPSSIAGIMEIHGIGLLRMPHCEGVALRLVVDCTQTPLERLPESQEFRQESLGVPRIALHPFHASAPAKIRLYMKALERGEALPADWFAQKGNSADAEKQQN